MQPYHFIWLFLAIPIQLGCVTQSFSKVARVFEEKRQVVEMPDTTEKAHAVVKTRIEEPQTPLVHTSNLNMLVLPYNQQDICQAFDELSQKQREAIDIVSQGFRDMGYQTGSFTSIMRKMKSTGGCDTHNPTRMLNTALATAQCAYYTIIETDFEELHAGNYLALNLTVYQASDHSVITQQTTDSDRKFTDDTRQLVKEAFEKMKINLARELEIPANNQPTTNPKTTEVSKKIKVNLISEVDKNLPKAKQPNPDAIAVVIGNANYEKTKGVEYALNDAAAMKQYLITTFGLKEGNIMYVEDARKSDFELLFGVRGNHKGKLFNNVKTGLSDVFVFYAGHGATGLNDKNGYFVPIDCDAQYMEIGGYPADVFYQNLAQIPARSFTVWLDACFSGTELVQNISPIVIKGKGIMGLPNGMLMTSSTDDQYATWYPEQGHGLFTYFLLKGIQDARGDKNGDNKLTYNELYQYMSDKTEGVPYWARKLNNIEQMPLIKGNTLNKVLIGY